MSLSSFKKNKRQDGKIKKIDKEEARRAIELASKLAFKAVENPNTRRNNNNATTTSNENEDGEGTKNIISKGDSIYYPCDLSDDSHASFLSRERAFRRGSKRGMFEALEVVHDGVDSFHGSIDLFDLDFDPTSATATETRLTSRSGGGRKNSKSKFSFSFLKKKKHTKSTKKDKTRNFLTAETPKEAWICGVCARSFSSYEAAEKHENYHIQEVVYDLGWSVNSSIGGGSRGNIFGGARNNNNLNTPSNANGGNGSNSNFQTPPRQSQSVTASQPRPDVLRVSTPGFSSRFSYQPNNTPALQRHKPKPLRRYSDDGQSLILDDDAYNDDLDAEYNLTTANQRKNYRPMSPIIEQQQKQQWRGDNPTDDELLVPNDIKDFVVLADEALVDVCSKAESLILTNAENEAETELEWLAKDKAYYDLLAKRADDRGRAGTYSKFRTEGKSIVSKVQNKFVDAYQLMKEGKTKRGATSMDHYKRKLKGDSEEDHVLRHTRKTLYVNVIVKNSLKVVSHELERLAKERWEGAQHANMEENVNSQAERFQKFRAVAQGNLVKLAGLALASDFTPRRIAIQLSNDLYRLLTPRLKKRGVAIETEIEYRVGPYFVLAVNIKSVDWRRLVKMTNRDVAIRTSKWQKQNDEETEGESRPSGVIVNFVIFCIRLSKLTKFDFLAQMLAWFYYLHWIVYTPICWILYHFLLAKTFREYFLSSVTDEIFYYVEEKGMEMDIGIRDASQQAAFMLSALREIRADGQELKKKKKEGESDAKGTVLGPLLGAAIKEDKDPAPPKPEGFEIPDNLEYIGLELDLPVGFRRLRQAFLSSKSTFISEAVFRSEAKYDNIEIGPWKKHDDVIGLPTTPEGIKEEEFIGVEKEMKYLMPKSAFVKANMCYETAYIEAYNDYCFCLKKKALTPEVPYGSTFVAWTKFVVVNTGADTCRLVCSVEAEFPNGPPLVGRQIKSGMRAGVGELFVKIGETITKYADEFP